MDIIQTVEGLNRTKRQGKGELVSKLTGTGHQSSPALGLGLRPLVLLVLRPLD